MVKMMICGTYTGFNNFIRIKVVARLIVFSCSNFLNFSIGLKTLIYDAPLDMGPTVSGLLCGRLLNGISRNDANDDIRSECIENMSFLLERFGNLIADEHETIMTTIVRQLEHSKGIVRKRAVYCLGNLAVSSNDGLLNQVCVFSLFFRFPLSFFSSFII